MKNRFKYLKAPIVLLGLALSGLFFFHETLLYRLVEQALAKHSIELSWKKSYIDFETQTIAFLEAELAPLNPSTEKTQGINTEQVLLGWRFEYPMAIRILNITLQGVQLELNSQDEQAPTAWLNSLIIKQLTGSQTNRIVSCLDCTLAWSQSETPESPTAITDPNPSQLLYSGQISFETKGITAPTATNESEDVPLKPAIALKAEGKLNNNPLSLSGTIKQDPSNENRFNLLATSTSPAIGLNLSLLPHVSLKTTSEILFSSTIESPGDHEKMTLLDWRLTLKFAEGNTLGINDTHPFISANSKLGWQKGSLDIYWDRNKDKSSLGYPEMIFNTEDLAGYLTPVVSDNAEIHPEYHFTIDALSTKMTHNQPSGWAAENTQLKQLRIENNQSASTLVIDIAKTDIQRIHSEKNKPKDHSAYWVADGVVSSGISAKLADYISLNEHWAHWLNHMTPQSPLVHFSDFSALTQSEIMQMSTDSQIEQQLIIQPFEVSQSSDTQSYLLTIRSNQLKGIARNSNQVADSSSENELPEARVMMNIDQEQCQFRSMIQAGQLGSFNEIYELLGPSLSEANLPIYLAEVFKSELEEQNLIYLGEHECDINQPLSILAKISSEAPRTLVEKSTERIASLKPDYAAHLVNRFSASSTLSELMVGQLRFKPLSNQLAHDQSAELKQIIARIKKLVSVSEQAQLRIQSSANNRDLLAWKETQNEPLKENDSKMFNVLARQRGLRLKNILLENGIEEDQLYLSRPKYDHENQEAFQVKIFL